MTNSERNTNHNLRKVGIGSLAALALVGGFAFSGVGAPRETSADNSNPTPSASEAAGATPTPSTEVTVTPEASQEPGVEAAIKNGDSWAMKDPDGTEVNISLPEGFTPDSRLVIQKDLKMNKIGSFKNYKDWDKVVHEVAGYNYDYNDFCQTEDFECNVQGDMWAWRVFQGQEVEIPGIGKLEGGPNKSVVVLFLNLQPNVIAWDKDELGQVMVKRGFTATGRGWDMGTPEKIAETEENLGGHWLFRQAEGTPEKSYIGITDDPENARETLYVAVAYRQWGNNEDGTPREQFQLLRAENVNLDK